MTYDVISEMGMSSDIIGRPRVASGRADVANDVISRTGVANDITSKAAMTDGIISDVSVGMGVSDDVTAAVNMTSDITSVANDVIIGALRGGAGITPGHRG